jgi:cytidyltransferase-like protein
MGSIAGLVSSPLFSLYAAGKAGLGRFIESVNIELEMGGFSNRILNVSLDSLKDTRFSGGENNPGMLKDLAEDIIGRMQKREELFIPEYEEIFKRALDFYIKTPRQFGIDSYNYLINHNSLNHKPQCKVGYLSGTFDLFHVGHLNLLERAKLYCDYLVVGVYPSGKRKGKETYIPHDERIRIISSLKCVDRVIEAPPEDSDAYSIVPYDFLFVGSDYKGTPRFLRYEDIFKNTETKIIYFPYTTGTSSTQLRDVLSRYVR